MPRIDQLSAHPRTTANPLTNSANAVLRDSALSSVNTRKVTLQEIRAYKYNVRDYGATGDGSTDDTSAIQTALTAASSATATYGIVFLPAGTYKTTATLNLYGGATLTGEGYNSVIAPTGVASAAVKLGTGTVEINSPLDGGGVSHLRITGSAGQALEVLNQTNCELDDINLAFGTYNEGFTFRYTWGSTFNNLRTNGATIANYCFKCTDAFNDNHCHNWYTSNYCTANIYIDGGNANAFSAITAQQGDIGLWVRGVGGGGYTFDGFYTEDCVNAVKLGDITGSGLNNGIAKAITIRGGNLGGPSLTHPRFTSHVAQVLLENAWGVTLDACHFNRTVGTTIGLSGGGGSGAIGTARATAAGRIHSIEVLCPGTGYVSAPTVSISNLGGSGASASVALSGTTIKSISVVSAGSGYTSDVGVGINYAYCSRINVISPYVTRDASVNSPFYPWITRHSAAPSTAGVNVFGDWSFLEPAGWGAAADVRKTRTNGYMHVISEYELTGTHTVTQYTPPVFP